MANNQTETITQAMIKLVDTAKEIYKSEPLSDLRISIVGKKPKYVELASCNVDREHYDYWDYISLDNSEEIEIAKKLIQRIQFKKEYVENGENYLHVRMRRTARIEKYLQNIEDLKNATFYSELHQEDIGYSFIPKKNSMHNIRKWQKQHPDVEMHYEDGIFEVYF